jgi:hypothetical protein
VNDFNTLDPLVYVVSEVQDKPNAKRRVLMFIDLNSESVEPFHVSRIEEASAGNKKVIDKAVATGIRLLP